MLSISRENPDLNIICVRDNGAVRIPNNVEGSVDGQVSAANETRPRRQRTRGGDIARLLGGRKRGKQWQELSVDATASLLLSNERGERLERRIWQCGELAAGGENADRVVNRVIDKPARP